MPYNWNGDTDDSVSGKGLLVSLCNLAKQINDYEELFNKLIERIPDFNMRMKVNPKRIASNSRLM